MTAVLIDEHVHEKVFNDIIAELLALFVITSFPLLRWEYMSAMAPPLKTWIQPLPDPDINQKKPRGQEYQTISMIGAII
jgi:hypothetical protein